MQFIAYTQRPEVQALLMAIYHMGAVNQAANALLAAKLQSINPTAPENLKQQIPLNNRWHVEHYGQTLQHYLLRHEGLISHALTLVIANPLALVTQ